MEQATGSPIIFYDIPSKAPGCAWSPNTWKTRHVCLTYKTVWVEYPDIADLCKRIGAGPSTIRDDGSPYYSLPVIQDPNTGAVVSDSTRIAEYLDATYPETLSLMPAGTRTLQKGFQFTCHRATDVSTQFIIPAILSILHPRSQDYYVRTREATFAAWKDLEAGFGRIHTWMTEGDPFVMGDFPSFADFLIAGKLQWYKKGFGEESDKWKDITTWHDGRWAKLLKNLEKYEGSFEERSE
ncbi:Glutathione S-transferase-like protein ustS [Mycena sanguinolenta]|uniref:Glutathione S-transferase-like protein ustS n=1 Tax=Mycena sanguinolenta TaxID=230812 RepID=A0A8H7CHV0_9AGAR|nr:Glutathione S-transferase-like protein ustS [Mycena sanguinolenta]